MLLQGGVSNNLHPEYDSKGNIYYTDDYGNPLEDKRSLLNKITDGIKAFGINAERRINRPTEEEQKRDTNTILALETLPIGAGAKITGAIARPLAKYVGNQIARTMAESIGAGALSGGVEEFGRGIINGEKPLDIARNTAIGTGIGALSGGVGGYGIGKIGQKLAFNKLYNNASDDVFRNYFNDYIEGVNNPVNAMADFRAARAGVRPGRTEKQYLFIGENAFNAPKGKLGEAQQMAMFGDSNADIRNATGWFKGVDGKWRYEIPDGKFNDTVDWNKLNDTQYYVPLKKLYKNDELYQAYPDIAELPIVKTPLDWQTLGGAYKYKDSSAVDGIMLNDRLFKNTPYRVWKDKMDDIYKTPEGALWKKADEDWWNNKITDAEYEKIYDDFFKTDIGKQFEYLRDNEPGYNTDFIDSINNDGKKSLLHEIQHVIQDKENFAQGGNMVDPNYRQLAGEVESRLVEQRYGLTPEQRQIYNPANESTYLTNYGYDVIPEKQIVKFKNDENSLYHKLFNDDDLTPNQLAEKLKAKAELMRSPKPISEDLKKGQEFIIMEGSEPFRNGEQNYVLHEITTNKNEQFLKDGSIDIELPIYNPQKNEKGFFIHTVVKDKDGYKFKKVKSNDERIFKARKI